MSHPNPVGWFEIYVDDLDRAQAFYEAVLKVTISTIPSTVPGLTMRALPMTTERYGAGGALVKMDGMTAGGNSTIVYFHCNDCADAESRVDAAGGRIIRSKFAIAENGFIALVLDSEGNLIGLHSWQ